MRDDASTNALIVEFLSHAEKTEEIFLAVGRVISTLLMHILRDSLICIQKAAIFLLTDGVEKVLESFVWLEEECLNNLELTSSVKQTVLKSVEWFTKSFPQHPFQNRSSSEYSVDNIRNFAPQGLRDTACESWLLLHSALIEKGVSSTLFGPLLSKSFFAEVLGALESHLHSVSATANPLLPHLVEYLSNRNPAHVAGSQEPPEEEIFLQHLLVGSDETQREKLLSNKLLLISELNSLANGTGSVASATGHDNGIFTFDNSACHSTFMVLLPRVSRTAVHSCVPSAHITTTAAGSLLLSPDRLVVDLPPLRETYQLQCLQEAQNRKSLRVDIVSLRDCNIGEESGEQLSISYVDDNIVGGANDLESRHAQLEARFPALSKMKTGSPLCSCSRCVFEKASFGQIGSPGVDTLKEVIKGFSSHQLLNVGHMCMQQHAYDNAKLLYTTLLERLCGKTCARCLAESSGEKVTETRSSSTDGKLVVIADATLSQIAGDAFHALGAAYLERSGDWERARLVWELGIQVAPLHSQLIAEVKKVHSYPTAKVRVKPCASVLLSVNEVQDLLKELPDQFTFRCASPESVLAFERFDALIRDTHYEILQSSDNGYSTALPDEGTNSKSTEIPPFLGLPVEVSKGVVLTTTTSSVSQVFLTSRQQPLLTAAECRHVIEATESFAAQSGGWSTSRHYAVPTTDIPVHIIKSSTSVAAGNGGGEVLGGESLLTWFNNIFTNRLAPLLASQYQGS